MIKKIQLFAESKMLCLLAVLLLAAITLVSCKKNKSGEKSNIKFVGTWNGTQSCTALGSGSGSNPVSYLISAGAGDNALLALAAIGSDSSCSKLITLNLTANGNSLTLPSQVFTDLCGNSWTFSGSGTLSGSTLTFTQNMTFTESGFPITVTCSYTLSK